MEAIVLYSRVSTLDQNFERQFEDLQVWAKLNNFNVVASYGEKVSGYDPEAERTEYENMKAYVLKNNIKNIGIWEISRLSRSMVTTVAEIAFFTKHKINLHFKKENLQSISDNVTNQLLITILSSMAQMERDTFIDRANSGRLKAVKRGRMIGYSNPPYGYTSDENGIIIVEEEEAKVIRMIFDLADKGVTLYGICQQLNSLGIPTRAELDGKLRTMQNGENIKIVWKPVVVRRNLQRTLYKGVRIYKGNEIAVPSIVSTDIWERVQQRFKDNIGYINRTKFEYLFKGKLKCGVCGRSWATYTNKKDMCSYYMCTGITDMGHKCINGKYISTKLIDKVIFKSLFEHLSINETVLDDKKKESKYEELKSQIIFFKNEIEKLEAKKKRLVKMFTEGFLEESEFNREQLTIKNLTVELNNKIKLNENSLTLSEDININELLTSIYRTDDYNLKREFVVKYINSVVIYNLKGTNIKFDNDLRPDDKILYAKVFAFNYPEPVHVVMTTRTNQVYISVIENMIDFNESRSFLTVK